MKVFSYELDEMRPYDVFSLYLTSFLSQRPYFCHDIVYFRLFEKIRDLSCVQNIVDVFQEAFVDNL